MTEQTPSTQELRPFSELLSDNGLVYHGIGADIVALAGIAEHGIQPAAVQAELTGVVNSNSTRETAFNHDSLVSVTKSPRPDVPNAAFMTYVEHSPISFAIKPQSEVEQPSERGYFDEAFIRRAERDDIVGVVFDSETLDQPFASQNILTGNVTGDVVAEKARTTLRFIAEKLDMEASNAAPELEEKLAGIAHISPEFVQMTMGMIRLQDQEKIKEVETWLQARLKDGLQTKLGNSEASVLEVVNALFPDKPLYVNDHQAGITVYAEDDYFDTLPEDAVLGYQRFDGSNGRASLYKVQKSLARLGLLNRE